MRRELREGQLMGTFVNIPHFSSTEILGRAGFKVLCLDSEHSGFELKDITEGIRAAESAGAWPLVRVPATGPVISQVLDAGAAGVIIPRVSSADEARSASSFAHFPPLGARGVGLSRAGGYGADDRYRTDPARRSYLIVQIETAAGLATLEAICSVEGVDMIMVGPYDLAASMGVELWSEKHLASVKEILAAAQRHGLATCLFVTSPEQIVEFSSLNVDLFLLSSDVLILARGAAAVLASAAAT
jgi:4-hydroxy-2-oxoheptanedioate aldolase